MDQAPQMLAPTTAKVSLEYHNGNIRANLRTESAAGALILTGCNGSQIPLFVGGIAHDDKLSRTGERAEPAPFAARFVYLNVRHGKLPFKIIDQYTGNGLNLTECSKRRALHFVE
jgi:hypothetical protein